MKMGDESSFMFDLLAMYTVTINNQLYLLKLIEMLYLVNIDTISANTDGIICKIPKELEDTYFKTCEIWEKYTKFNLEYTDYNKYICYAINDYMAISPGYDDTDKSEESKNMYIKSKGLFLTKVKIDKGYKYPIVAKALMDYYADNVPIEDTIRNHTNIYDFCISIKTGSDFIKEYQRIINGKLNITILQKNVRYFISNTGGIILKKYKEVKIDIRGQKREYISLHKGYYSTIFNDYYPCENFKNYNINYNYYIKEAHKILNDIANISSLKMKTQNYNGLFNDI